ncbi:hypothetical protein R5W24_006514 [Gemmata sp. JC717]|uniref:hypothetical protein n=1 Tax=Gemmata algarum TaxID=2975278 RepID=UPI0021BB635E|nr:hypothetical protein [Gemmata algarum]MDY3557326.1 hypothetical protein [Gemmata algarum]
MMPLPDSVAAILWLGVTSLLLTAAWVLAARLSPTDTFANRIAHVIILAWTHLVVIGTVLGTVGLLYPPLLLVGVFVAALITVTITRTAALSNPERKPRCVVWRIWTGVWIVLLALGIGHVIVNGLLRFPDDWDTLMYHLPMVDHWIQAGSLYAPDELRWSDPGNNELITLWVVGPFSGDYLYALTNLPAVVLLTCASIELGRRVGLTDTWRNLGALAVVSNVVVVKQLIDVENDVSVAALFLAALASALRYVESGEKASLTLGAVGLGLLSGVKYYALGYAAVVAVTAAMLIAWRHGGRTAARAAIWGVMGILLLGGYWYIRNWVFGGSPLYPLGGNIDGSGLGSIYPASLWTTTFVGNGSSQLPELALKAVWGMTGPCHVIALLCLPGVIVWLGLSGLALLRHQPARGHAGARIALAFATVASGAVLLITPFAVEDAPGTLNQMHWKYCPVRYGLCFLSLVVFGFVLMLQCIAHGLRDVLIRSRKRSLVILSHVPAVLFIAGIGCQLSMVCHLDQKVVSEDSLLIALNFVLAIVILRQMTQIWVSLWWLLSLGIAMGVAFGCDGLAAPWHAGFNGYYDRMLAGGLFRQLGDELPPGSCVCVLDLRPYPFFGSARQFKVCQPAHLRSEQELAQYVRERGIVLIVARLDMSSTARGWRRSLRWLNDNKMFFIKVYDIYDPYIAFRVVPTDAALLRVPEN